MCTVGPTWYLLRSPVIVHADTKTPQAEDSYRTEIKLRVQKPWNVTVTTRRQRLRISYFGSVRVAVYGKR